MKENKVLKTIILVVLVLVVMGVILFFVGRNTNKVDNTLNATDTSQSNGQTEGTNLEKPQEPEGQTPTDTLPAPTTEN